MLTPEHQQLLDALGAKTQQEAMAEIGKLRGIAHTVHCAQTAISAEADFEAMTWTFDITKGCKVGAGPYALVRLQPNTQAKPCGEATSA